MNSFDIPEDVITQHRELEFLNGNSVFQRRYIETVITRIFYTVARTLPPLESDVLSGAAKGIKFQEFKRSNFLDVLKHLSDMEINEVGLVGVAHYANHSYIGTELLLIQTFLRRLL